MNDAIKTGEAARRWRMVLGKTDQQDEIALSQADLAMDRTLESVYGQEAAGGRGRGKKKGAV